MKTLFLIRHAKSSWKEPLLSDADRPLNKRGKRDAPFMSQLLAEKGEKLEFAISSPARRARTTAKHFVKRFSLDAKEFVLDEQLYLADEDEILETVHLIPDKYHSAALFGHNPGFTYFANLFTNFYIENVPTCGIVKLVSVCDHWKEFEPNNTKMTSFYFPKQFL